MRTPVSESRPHHTDTLLPLLRKKAQELGFQQLGVAPVELGEAEAGLLDWLALGRHGDMHYMERHGLKRSRPPLLVPGTASVICVSMDYLPGDALPMETVLQQPDRAAISRYALGRDYHKLIRQRLKQLCAFLESLVPGAQTRLFTDSAPVLEKPLAVLAGLGWAGKHTNVIHRRRGSWFFLGEIYTNLALPHSPARESDHCGQCHRCMDACPTGAIVAPYELDARLCISYLTIEHDGPIPPALRPMLGNRIYGCDDCQLVCPWNRFAQPTPEADFQPRHGLDRAFLLNLWQWDEATFLRLTEGSPIRRIGYRRWQRNLAVALGNAPPDAKVVEALQTRLPGSEALVAEHIHWALKRQKAALQRLKASATPLAPG